MPTNRPTPSRKRDLEPLIDELYLERGVSPQIIREELGLSRAWLGNYLWHYGLTKLREQKMREDARKVINSKQM